MKLKGKRRKGIRWEYNGDGVYRREKWDKFWKRYWRKWRQREEAKYKLQSDNKAAD